LNSHDAAPNIGSGSFATGGKMTDESSSKIIKLQQKAWAKRTQRTLDRNGYCGCFEDNLFQALSDNARTEFEAGGGRELDGKMRAVHSSSALACNWFDYWRERDFGVLSAALGVPSPFVALRLEAKLPTGMRGGAANLDVLLTTADGALFGIESKFTEAYTPSPTKRQLQPAYFAQGRLHWTEAGLPGCQAVAERLRTGQHEFTVLDVAQLLKHMLALGRTGNRWTLCSLWYEVPGPAADAHRAELQKFTSLIGSDAARFTALTYQELFARMERAVGAEDAGYMAYLRDRYVSASAP
jgi:hypothetical protein